MTRARYPLRAQTTSEHGGNTHHPFLLHPAYQPSRAGIPPGLPPVPRRSDCGRSPLGRPSSDPEEAFPLPPDHEVSTLYVTQYGTERSASTDLGHTSDADADTRMADSILGSTTAHAARGTWQQTHDNGEGAGADPSADANIEEGDLAGSGAGGPSPSLNGPQRLTPVRWASGGGAQPPGSAVGGAAGMSGRAAAPVAATAAMAAAAWGTASSPSPLPGPDGSASVMGASALGRVSGGGSLAGSAYARRRSSGGGAGSLGGSAHGRISASGGAGGGFGGAVAVGAFGLGDGDDLGEEGDEYGGGLMGLLAALPDSVLNSIPPALLQHLQQLEEERDELAGRLLDAGGWGVGADGGGKLPDKAAEQVPRARCICAW